MKELQDLLEAKENPNSIKFRDLTNQFLTLIPHKFHRDEASSFVINSKTMVNEKLEMLDTISQIKVAYTLLQNDEKADDPLMINYKKLNTKIEPLDKKSKDFKMIQEYVKNSSVHSVGFTLELEEVFRIERKGEEDKFIKLDNRQLLWHGSRLPNWVGILSQVIRYHIQC